MNIRNEKASDIPGIRKVNLSAFPTPAEAHLVEHLRKHATPVISMVAEIDSSLVGHILFTPVELPVPSEFPAMGLAPLAVLPELQNQGIGAALVRCGLAACEKIGAGSVILLGHPNYYPRFGFIPASRFDLTSEFGAPDEAFMALELIPGALKGISGLVRFHPDFANI